MGFRNCVQEFRGIPLVWSCFKEFKAPIWRDTRVLEYQVFGVLELLSGFWSYSQGFGCTTRVLNLLSGFLKLLSRVWSYSQGFGVTPRVLELLSGVWSYSQGFKVAPKVFELLPGLWSCSQGFWVILRVFELFSGFWKYSQGFWVAYRVLEVFHCFGVTPSFGVGLRVFGVVPRVLELPPPSWGFIVPPRVWICSDWFGDVPRGLKLLRGF